MDNNASKNAYKQQQKEAFENSLPISREIFEELFDYLDEALEEGCDDTLRLTETFLHSQSVKNVDEILHWLNDNGGYCDCEVLGNVEEIFD